MGEPEGGGLLVGRAGRPQVPGLGPGPRRPTGSSPPPPRLSCDSDSALRELQPAVDFWGIFASPVGEAFLALAALRACRCHPLLSSEAGESGPGVEEEGAGRCGEDEGGPGTRGAECGPCPPCTMSPAQLQPSGQRLLLPWAPCGPGGHHLHPGPTHHSLHIGLSACLWRSCFGANS